MCQVFYYKIQVLLQNATQCFCTKCNTVLLYKMQHSASVHRIPKRVKNYYANLLRCYFNFVVPWSNGWVVSGSWPYMKIIHYLLRIFILYIMIAYLYTLTFLNKSPATTCLPFFWLGLVDFKMFVKNIRVKMLTSWQFSLQLISTTNHLLPSYTRLPLDGTHLVAVRGLIH